MKRPSQRFTPTKFTAYAVPIALIFLTIFLIAIIVLVGLAVAGVLPGG
jgi:hypothetical protein